MCHNNIDVRSSSSSFYAASIISVNAVVLFQTVITLNRRGQLFCDCDGDNDAEFVSGLRG